MRTRFLAAVLVLSFLLVLSGCAHKKMSVAPPTTAVPLAGTPKVSEHDLISHGFTFDPQPRPMCEISGSEGICRVEAFVTAEKGYDQYRNTCSKLDKASYVGHCVDGKLEGVSLIIADGSAKDGREAFILYVHEGRAAYPALTSSLDWPEKNFGVQQLLVSYGCVYYGKWDNSDGDNCDGFRELYGADIFSEPNAQKLRDGTFDLNPYRATFMAFLAREYSGETPKARVIPGITPVSPPPSPR